MKVYRIDYVCTAAHHVYIEAESEEEAIATFEAGDFEESEFDYCEEDNSIDTITVVSDDEEEDEKDPNQTSMFD